MSSVEEIDTRLEVAEATLQAMLCTVTADLLLLQAVVTALREEGVLTEKIVDRIAINSQLRLQQFNAPALTQGMIGEIGTQLDNLTERLRGAMPSAPLVNPAAIDNGNGRGNRNRRTGR